MTLPGSIIVIAWRTAADGTMSGSTPAESCLRPGWCPKRGLGAYPPGHRIASGTQCTLDSIKSLQSVSNPLFRLSYPSIPTLSSDMVKPDDRGESQFHVAFTGARARSNPTCHKSPESDTHNSPNLSTKSSILEKRSTLPTPSVSNHHS